MGTDKRYRVGVMGDTALWLTQEFANGGVGTLDCNAFGPDRTAEAFDPKTAMFLVQVLTDHYQCVVVEAVEVAHD